MIIPSRKTMPCGVQIPMRESQPKHELSCLKCQEIGDEKMRKIREIKKPADDYFREHGEIPYDNV
jgi:hypothetical protein